MKHPPEGDGPDTVGRARRQSKLLRALREFLALPMAIVAGLLMLAVISAVCDRSDWPWLRPARHLLQTIFPPEENSSMLTTVAPGMLTVMTITFFLFLTLVQRMAELFTWLVIEQFFLRRSNQVVFGFYTGLSVYYVMVLALEGPPQAPFSTLLALILTILGLVGLLVFGYLVLDQLRPPAVVDRIVENAGASRARQLERLGRLRSAPQLAALPSATVYASSRGHIVDIDFEALGRWIARVPGDVEVEFFAGLGAHLVAGAPVAAVRAENAADRQRLGDAVLKAVRAGRERQIDRDAVHGVHQLSSMAWAAVNQPDPEAALVAIAGLQTLLAEWTDGRATQPDGADGPETLPVVYPDNTVDEVLSSLSSAIVASSSNHQYQTCAAILDVFATALPRLSSRHQGFAVEQLRRVLPSAANHSYTPELQRELSGLRRAMTAVGHHDLAAQLSGIEARMDDD